MFHLTSAGWLAGTLSSEDRGRIDHVALHEARIATDHRQHRADDEALARSQERRRGFSLLHRSDAAAPDLAACCA